MVRFRWHAAGKWVVQVPRLNYNSCACPTFGHDAILSLVQQSIHPALHTIPVRIISPTCTRENAWDLPNWTTSTYPCQSRTEIPDCAAKTICPVVTVRTKFVTRGSVGTGWTVTIMSALPLTGVTVIEVRIEETICPVEHRILAFDNRLCGVVCRTGARPVRRSGPARLGRKGHTC